MKRRIPGTITLLSFFIALHPIEYAHGTFLFQARLAFDAGYGSRSVVIRVPEDLPTIQACLDHAEEGDVGLVAPGTYVERIDFLGKAVSLRSEAGLSWTTIDGNGGGSVVQFRSGETAGARLQGFTITNGRASRGGGIYCGGPSPGGSTPGITGSTISGNSAVAWGGGIALDCPCSGVRSAATLENCTLSGNWIDPGPSAGGGGGGLFTASGVEAVDLAWLRIDERGTDVGE